MALSDTFDVHHSCLGDACAFGSLDEVVERIEAFLRKTLPKIIGNLRGWNAGKTKRHNEKYMASKLTNELNFNAPDGLFYFHSEDPENESATRTLDWGVYPKPALSVRGYSFGAQDRLYGIEAKRFPTHGTPLEGREREREYVVGDWEAKHMEAKRLSGGIERFKEGQHGVGLERGGMIAFVQRESASHWFAKVNQWIADLIAHPLKSHQAKWTEQDRLVSHSSQGAGIAEYCSTHDRQDGSVIELRHFWLDLTAM